MTDPLLSTATAGGHLVKMEVDYSATCDEKIPALKAEAAGGRLQDAINGLLALEKQTRTVSGRGTGAMRERAKVN